MSINQIIKNISMIYYNKLKNVKIILKHNITLKKFNLI